MKHKETTKVLITGPESTGKSTIATFIANHWGGTLIPEYARTYLKERGPSYVQADLLQIAKQHYKQIENEEKESIKLVLDTYLINIKIWSEYKYDNCDPWITTEVQKLSFDYIFLTQPDVPWSYDPLRENEFSREEIFILYKEQLDRLKLEYILLESDEKLREEQVSSILKI